MRGAGGAPRVQVRSEQVGEAGLLVEGRQRAERERRAKQKHVEQLLTICSHGKELQTVNKAAQDRIFRLGKSVLAFHAHTEKEEQKRIERISKERLKALKADDEEAYMKLIDTAKDTRITHLLRQTDAYLDSLTQAVMEQQRDGSIQDGGASVMQQYDPDDSDPTSEAMFGVRSSVDGQLVQQQAERYPRRRDGSWVSY